MNIIEGSAPVTTGQKVKATVVGVHNASTGVVAQPVVSGAKKLGSALKGRYSTAKAAKVEQYAKANAQRPVVAEPVDTVPAGISDLLSTLQGG